MDRNKDNLVEIGMNLLYDKQMIDYPAAFPLSRHELWRLITATASAMDSYAPEGHPDHELYVRLNHRLNEFAARY